MTTADTHTTAAHRKHDHDDDIDKELDMFIEKEETEKTHVKKPTKHDSDDDEKHKPPDNKERNSKEQDADLDRDLDQELEQIEKGQRETSGRAGKEKVAEDSHSDNDDSEPEDFNITEDQRRAMQELDNLYPDEDPPEYNVKERLQQLNQELADDPTPTENNRETKVVFKDNLVDLVAPPPDYNSDDDTSAVDKDGKNTQKDSSKQHDDADDSSEKMNNGRSGSKGNTKENKVLIERDGKFELINADEVTANDLGVHSFENDRESDTSRRRGKKGSYGRQPAPPSKPRPATANGSSRRSTRPASSKQRAQSAGTDRGHELHNFDYQSPYAMTPQQKDNARKRHQYLEEQQGKENRKKKDEDEEKQRESNDAFAGWLKKKREDDRKKREEEEEEKKKQEKEDMKREEEENKGMKTYDHLYLHDPEHQSKENEESFNEWVKVKSQQVKHEKLLKKRQDQEMTEGYFVRSRPDCDKAFRQWLKHKNTEIRQRRTSEKQRAKAYRTAAKKAKKTNSLAKTAKQSQSFRYVDYYGYRF